MATKPVVRIDVLPDSAWRQSGFDAIVCVDVLLSATTIVSALAGGRRVFPVHSAAEGLRVKARHGDALLATDALDGTSGPVTFAGPTGVTANAEARPLVHVSPLAEMLGAAAPGVAVYVACLRNLKATAMEIARSHWRVAVLAAGETGEVCAEDQMAAAWLAGRLKRRGFGLEGRGTVAAVARWKRPDVSLVGWSRSAERLRGAGHGDDVDFVLAHVDDLNIVCRYGHGELRAVLHPAPRPEAVGSGPAIRTEGGQ